MRPLPLVLALAAAVAGAAGFLLPTRSGSVLAHPDPLDSCYYVYVHAPDVFGSHDPGVAICPNKPVKDS